MHTYFTPVHRPTTHPMELGALEHEVLSVLERRAFRTLARYGLDSWQPEGSTFRFMPRCLGVNRRA